MVPAKVFNTIINALDERLKEIRASAEAPDGEEEDFVEEVELEAESEAELAEPEEDAAEEE